MPTIGNTVESSAVAERLQALAAEWKGDTSLLSSTSAMTAHPAYQAIIALGPAVVPLLLREMEHEPVHWFEALQAITGEDPVPVESWGNIRAMADAWMVWGRTRGFI